MTRYCWVWWARTEPDEDRLLPVLDEDEQERYAAYQDAEQQLRFGSGRLVAKSVIADMVGRRPADIRFATSCVRCGGPHGKPALPPDLPPLDLSISTTSTQVVVAVMNGFPVGVDLLEVDACADVGALARQNFNEDERALWAGLPAERRLEGYFRVCVRKNALLKALGLLADYPLNKIAVSAADQRPGMVSGPPSSAARDVHGAQLFDLEPGAGHVGTLTVLNCGGVVVREQSWEPMTSVRGRLRLL